MDAKNSSIFEDLMNFRGGIGDSHKGEETLVKKLKPTEEMLMRLSKKGINLSQMEGILKTKGIQLVVSCAGSGKTTTLIYKIIYDIKSGVATKVVELKNGNTVRIPDSIWVCTFLKSGADELAQTFRRSAYELGLDVGDSVQFSTIHAEFLRALKQYGFSKPLISASENTKFLKEVVKPYALTNGRGNALNSEDYSNLEGALAYTRNRLDGLRYNKEIYDELNISKPIIDAILRDWKSKRAKAGMVDFDDLQELLWEECYLRNNKELIRFLSSRYAYMYIDEFQDTSQVQYEVLKVYASEAKGLFVIGDDDQTIYSWRGSDHKIITEKFIEDFNPTVQNLSVNYRCPKNILDAIKPSIVLNKDRHTKDLESFGEGGTVRVIEGSGYSDMAEKLVNCVYKDLEDGLSVAILCRVNSDGLLPAMMFDKLDRFSFSISGEGMTLNSYIGRLVLSIVKLFTEKSSPAVKRALEQLVWDKSGIANLMKVCKTNKMSIWTIDMADLCYSCPELGNIIAEWRRWRDSFGEVGCLSRVLDYYRVNVFQKDTQFNNVVRSTLQAVSTMLNVSGCESASEFEFDLDNMNERLLGRVKLYRHKVQIATVHEYKGKEADSVYVWNDSVDVFPIKGADENIDEYEEERRIHYIACTRAKKISTLVYLRDKQGAFVDEMDLSNAERMQVVLGTAVDEIAEKSIEAGNLRGFIKRALSGAETEDDTQDIRVDFEEVMGGVGVPSVRFTKFNEDVEERNSRIGDDSDSPNEFWGME